MRVKFQVNGRAMAFQRVLERGKAVEDLVQAGEVVGGQDFALHDGKVDFRPGPARRRYSQHAHFLVADRFDASLSSWATCCPW